jgi:thymidylate synthase (FAD)
MKIIQPYVVIETEVDGAAILRRIEKYGRTCYKSEDKITDTSAETFVKMILDPSKKHESVLEHESISVRFTSTEASPTRW